LILTRFIFSRINIKCVTECNTRSQMGQGHTIEYSFGTLLKCKTGILFDVNEKKRFLNFDRNNISQS